MTDEMIPDALPEGFGDNVEVGEDSPHPNKQRKSVHMLEMWHDLHQEMPSMALVPMVPLGPEDMAIFAAGLSTLWADVQNGLVSFGEHGDAEGVAKELKAQCVATLRKIVAIADPHRLPGADKMGGHDNE